MASNPVNSNIFDITTDVITAPPAGSAAPWPLPANSRIQALIIGFTLQTDGNVANRYATVLSEPTALTPTEGACTIAQTANNIYYYSFIAGLPQQVDLSAEDILLVPMSPNIIFDSTGNMIVHILNIQAGDVFTYMSIRYKRWIIA